MATVNMTNEQKTLLNLIGNNLFSMPLNIDENVDWNSVISESEMQTVELIAFNKYKYLPISEENKKHLKDQIKKNNISTVNCFEGHRYIHNLMSKNDIPYCIIKGVASARYYPEPMLRSMGDIDFYVSPDNLSKAKEILKADGFEFIDKAHPHHLELKKDTKYLELHFAPIDIFNNKMQSLLYEYWSDICETAKPYNDGFAEYVLPSAFHHGFILLTHFQSHLISSGVGLRHLCDWAVFVNSFSNEEFISIFQSKLKKAGLWRLAQVLSLVSVKYFGAPHQEWMGNDFATAQALLLDVFHGGNFGRKERNRTFQGFFISNNKKSSQNKSPFIRKFASVTNIIKRRWPIAEKYPILCVFGFVFFSVRVIVNVVLGRRKVDFIGNYKQIDKRTELYTNLRLFEPEE